ncbi:hypothetical protein CKAH01_16217 [Colletotrichum kahawae]|uniref:Uncharacterized protein n=1 Tax=Colletotrichum kahawae TaxID=34407 RepID=A0AAE0D5U7_COLKA|nr:hypothetical protein CKAH01_16217 [Colletotrichum kahawae]
MKQYLNSPGSESEIACGNFLVVTADKVVDVVNISVINVPQAPLDGLASRTNAQHIESDQQNSALSKRKLTSLNTENQTALGNAATTQRAIQLTTENRQIQLQSIAGAECSSLQSVQLLNVPQSLDLRSTQIDLQLPQPGSENLTIIINKSATEAYGINGENKTQFPTVVDRNVQSLALNLEWFAESSPSQGDSKSQKTIADNAKRRRLLDE